MKYKGMLLCISLCLIYAAVPAYAAESSKTGVLAPAAVVISGQDGVRAGAARYISAKEAEQQTGGRHSIPSNGTPMTQEELNTLEITAPAPLTAGDFHLGGLYRGDSLNKVKRLYGSPSKYMRSAHYTTMTYNDADLRMKVSSRNDTAAVLKEPVGEQPGVQVGVESVFLSGGKTVDIGRGLRLKSPVEVLIRQFGAPSNVLRDADANVYYFVYDNPQHDTMFVFAIADRKIERVALMPARLPYSGGETRPADRQKRLQRDFTLMGFGLDTAFQANKYNMWNNLVKRNGNAFWLYGDYGVEVDRRNTVRKVFLLTNNAYTSRGATLGYHISTVLSLYGRPDRVEIGPETDTAVDAYYYDSPFQKGVSLVFVVKHQTQYVDDVILISSPIQQLQDPLERYGLK